jgi:hypothetical protein
MYERQTDPIERPAAICPDCHRNTILCDMRMLSVPVMDHDTRPPRPRAEIWGRYDLTGSDVALCNSHGCGWSGTFSEARAALEGTVEATTSDSRFRIWVKESLLTDAPQIGYTPEARR